MDGAAFPTEVFTAVPAAEATTGVAFLARSHAYVPDRRALSESVLHVLDELAAAGWQLGTGDATGASTTSPVAYDTSLAHDVDFAGMFEVPSVPAALRGIQRLENAGWSRLCATTWLVGPRDLAAVSGNPTPDSNSFGWGFLALWRWNDAWHSASAETRGDYDAACDRAFAADFNSGIHITGRYDVSFASEWDHLALWKLTHYDQLDHAMHQHEAVADFMFTTSRHYLGRRASLAALLGGSHA